MGADGFLGAEVLIMPETLQFSIEREGAIVEDQTITTVAAANAYFNDRVLDLDPIKSGLSGTLDFTLLLQMITISGTNYSVNFLVADVGGLRGDYNDDDAVDSADYVVCRKGLGSTLSWHRIRSPADSYAIYNKHGRILIWGKAAFESTLIWVLRLEGLQDDWGNEVDNGIYSPVGDMRPRFGARGPR